MAIHVLVVDEESDISYLFDQHFKNEIALNKILFNYALSSEEALKLLQTEAIKADFVVILSDINMPGMRGIDLLKTIKKKFPDLSVIMLTSYGNAADTLLAWECGAEEIITKPINFDYLKNIIDELSRLRKLKDTGYDDDNKNFSSR